MNRVGLRLQNARDFTWHKKSCSLASISGISRKSNTAINTDTDISLDSCMNKNDFKGSIAESKQGWNLNK